MQNDIVDVFSEINDLFNFEESHITKKSSLITMVR